LPRYQENRWNDFLCCKFLVAGYKLIHTKDNLQHATCNLEHFNSKLFTLRMKSPFKFLDSYTKDDREVFFGREKEIAELYRRVFDSRIMVVYGMSGTGKSSLIHCGLASKFRESDWLNVNIRRGENLIKSMAEAIGKASLKSPGNYQKIFGANDSNEQVTYFRKAVKNLYLDYYKPIYFIFDQFEELFIFGTKKEDEIFIKVIQALLASDLQCKFIFIIREEYLGWLTTFEKSIPGFFNNRIRIEKMDIGNAKNAIEGPCKIHNITVEEGFAETLLEKLSAGETDVELTYLQVYLDKIFRQSTGFPSPLQGEKKGGSPPVFTLSLLKKTGNVSNILGSFLDDQISNLPDPDTAMTVLKAFVSARGTKRPVNVDEIREYALTTGKEIDEKIINDLLISFVNLRILQDKDLSGRNELKHDALAAKIFEKVTLVEKELIDIKQFIETAHENWKKRDVLLSDKDLSYIAPYEDKLYLNEELKSFISKSKWEYQRFKHRRRNIFIASGIGLLVVFACFTVWALLERDKSQKMEIIANANYFSASSKEITNQNPSKALRLAFRAYELNPDPENYQNLVNIYSNNEFYYPILMDKNFIYPEYRILGNNAIAIFYQKRYFDFENYCIDLYNSNEELIRKWDINQDVYYWGVSSDLKSVVTIGSDSILNIYDQDGNLKIYKKLDIKEDLYPRDFKILPNSNNIVLFFMSNSETSGVVYLYSKDGEIINITDNDFKESTYLADYIFDDNFAYFFYATGDMERISYDGKDRMETGSVLTSQEVLNSATLINGDRFALTTLEKHFYICDLQGNIIKSFNNVNENIFKVREIKKKDLLLILNTSGIQIWDYSGNTIKSLLINGISDYFCNYDSVNNRVIFMYDGKFYAWNIGNTGNNLILKNKEGHSYYPGDQYIVDRVKDTISLLNKDGIKIKSLPIKYKNTGLNIFPSFKYILIHNISDADSFALISDWESNIVTILKGVDNRYFTTAVSRNDSLILSTIGYQRVYFGLWSLDGTHKKTYIGHDERIQILKISDDNKKILSGDLDGNVILWDTSGKQIKRLKAHTTYITTLDISPDGSLFLTGSWDGTAKLWNKSGQLLFTFQSPEINILIKARFSSDNKSFYVSDTKNIRLFNNQGILLQTFANGSFADDISISADNKRIYYPDRSGIREIGLKQPLDTFLSSGKFGDLTIEDKLDHGYLEYDDLLNTRDNENIYSGAKYFRTKSMIVTDPEEKYELLNKAELLYEFLCSADTTSIRFSVNYTEFLLDKANSTDENVKPEIDKIYKTLLARNNYFDLFTAGRYYQGNTNSSTVEFEFQKKAISVFNKIIQLYPEKKRELDSQVGSLAWQIVYLKKFDDALNACLLALRINPEGFYANINLAPCYLLVDSVDKAKKLYAEMKDRLVPLSEIQNDEKFFGDVFISDLKDLKYRGFNIPEYEEIMLLLGADSTDLR